MTDYEELRKKHGEHAARAAEVADAVSGLFEAGKVSYGAALSAAYGSAYRPVSESLAQLLRTPEDEQ